MAIDDPHAIPENEADCAEYEQEADRAWDAQDVERACDLYRALSRSHFSTAAQASKANHRRGLVALNAGDKDSAWDLLSQSSEPGAKELMQSLDMGTPDAALDPSRPPASVEEVDAYWAEAAKARQAGDWATAARWMEPIASSSVNSADVQAWAMTTLAEALHRMGKDDDAKGWLDLALPALTGDQLELAQDLRLEMGVKVSAGATPAETALNDGIGSFRMGELDAAKADLETVSFLDGSNGELIGKAAYYLGSIAYHAHDYDTARIQFSRAEENAADPERAWAKQMLEERWGDTA